MKADFRRYPSRRQTGEGDYAQRDTSNQPDREKQADLAQREWRWKPRGQLEPTSRKRVTVDPEDRPISTSHAEHDGALQQERAPELLAVEALSLERGEPPSSLPDSGAQRKRDR